MLKKGIIIEKQRLSSSLFLYIVEVNNRLFSVVSDLSLFKGEEVIVLNDNKLIKNLL